MVAYTNYKTDARVMREAITAFEGGYSVDFISLKRNNELKRENINGINLYRLNQERYRGNNNIKYLLAYFEFLIRCFFKINFLLLSKWYSIIHLNNLPDFIVFCAIIPKLFGAKIILDIHDPMPNLYITKKNNSKNSLIHKLIIWQQKVSAGFSNVIVTVTEPVKTFLIKDGISPQKIYVVANFADEQIFSLNNNYSIDGKLKLLFHGTIAERYGIKNILFALSKLKNRDVFFKIIGEGDYSKQIKQLIVELNLEDVVVFDNNFYNVSELVSKINGYNLGIVCMEDLPSTDYALSVKMLEYFLIGMPVLTINNSAVKYYLDGKGCFFYNPKNVDSIVQSLLMIMNNREYLLIKRKEIIEIRSNYFWGNEKKKYLQIIKSLE